MMLYIRGGTKKKNTVKENIEQIKVNSYQMKAISLSII